MLRILLLLLFTSHMTCVAATPDASIPFRQSPNLKTGQNETLKLHIFQPENWAADDRRPAIVIFHGGGWRSGKPKVFYPHCEYFASRGLVAIAPEYRVYNRAGTDPREAVKDARSALRYIRSHASELGIDPDRIIVAGGSAGAHLAACSATIKSEKTTDFDHADDNTGISPAPQALILYYPVIDNGDNPDTRYGWDQSKSPWVQDYWQTFSPMHNVRANMPPTLIMLGTKDHLIPVAVGENFKAKMEAVGARCELILYEGKTHGFEKKDPTDLKQTLQDAERFLISLDYLPAP